VRDALALGELASRDVDIAGKLLAVEHCVERCRVYEI
jgi:hypothetical protein